MRVPCRLVVVCALVLGVPARADEALADKANCLQCHSVEQHKVGPSFKAVAARYRNDPGAREALIRTTRNGGRGNWTDVSKGAPMPAHSNLVLPADIERLVDWILRL